MTIKVKEIGERAYLIEQIERLEEKVTILERHTYAAPHVWNLVAKILRENAPPSSTGTRNRELDMIERSMLSQLALAFAKRFQEDEGFDPITWLDKCSPDPDLYPFSELWEEVDV